METKWYKVEIYKTGNNKVIKTYVYDSYWKIDEVIDLLNEDYYTVISAWNIILNPYKEDVAKDLGIEIKEEEQSSEE